MQHSHLQTANSNSDQYKTISRYITPQFKTNTSLCSRTQMFNAINTKVHHWTESQANSIHLSLCYLLFTIHLKVIHFP